MTSEELDILIKKCRKHDRNSQRLLYRHFYNYGMTICIRYAAHREEAKEILNDGFVKVFSKLDLYSGELSFKSWLNKILVNTAIDHFRARQNKPTTTDIDEIAPPKWDDQVLEKLAAADLFKMVNQLPPAYRMVFNLYVVEGFKHAEIAEKLNITIGTSKSNLAKAKNKLKGIIAKYE